MSGPQKIVCDICPRSFETVEQLSQHKRDSHKISLFDEKSKGDRNDKLKCPNCNRLYQTAESLTQHMKASHTTHIAVTDQANSQKSPTAQSPSVVLGSRKNEPSVQDPIAKEAYTCKECSKVFKTTAQLEQHVDAKHRSSSSREMVSSRTDTFQCPGCLRSFSTLSQLEQHLANTGHGDSSFVTRNKTCFPCETCPKKFEIFEHLEQHKKATGHLISKEIKEEIRKETGRFPCTTCARSFTSLDALRQHESASHGAVHKHSGDGQTEKKANQSDCYVQSQQSIHEVITNKFPCEFCKRSFSSSESLKQHEVASHNDHLTDKVNKFAAINKKEERENRENPVLEAQSNFNCKFCKRSFSSCASLEQHEKASHGSEPPVSKGSPIPKTDLRSVTDEKKRTKFRCPKCAEEFNTTESLTQHQRATNHLLKKETKARANYIRSVLDKKAAVKEEDRKESIAIVKENADKIMAYVRKLEGGKIYLPDLRKAGSSSVNTKIGKADEFDKNVTLNVNIIRVRKDGHLSYAYKDKLTDEKEATFGKNMNIVRELVDTRHFQYDIPTGQASVEVDSTVPRYLLYDGDLIPHKVQQDLHNKVKEAIEKLNLKDVHLSKMAHGPAITLTITKPPHNISVDFTVSLPCEDFIKVTDAGWPREQTRKAISQEHITACINAGIHLVPKGDETWSISYSKAEKALFEKIDGSNTCRRQVIQYMKWMLQVCKSRSGDGLPGISSFLVKQQVLWSSEGKTDPSYWHMANLETCVLQTMEDFVKSLRDRIIPHYFNVRKNILSNKSRDVLQRVADFFDDELKHLKEM